MFLLPPYGFFVLCAALIGGGAVEFVRLARAFAPRGPLLALPILTPLAALAMSAALHGYWPRPGGWLFAAALLSAVGFGLLVLWSRTPLAEVLPSLGALAFGLPYFAMPIAALYWIRLQDAWLIFLLCAIVWLGDTAALYFGKALGRHLMAPVVSPRKSWEGSIAGLLIGVLSTVVWAMVRAPQHLWLLVPVAVTTAIAAQSGDLVESLIKRAAGVKDSGDLLPGHGGLYDRMDAMLFAAPTFLAGLWAVDFPGF